MTAEPEYWACRVCRSINSPRSGRCYKCSTPREAAGVKPTELPTTGQAAPVEHTGAYVSSEMRAVAVTLVAAIFILGTFVATYLLWQVGDLRSAGQRARSDELFTTVTPLVLAMPLVGGAALVAYGAWISRVVSNLPALGLGYSRASPTFAFIEPLIPGFNLYALPARLGEALRKLDEKGPGVPLLGLAWVLFVGAAVAAGVLIRISREFETTGDFLRTSGFTLFLAFTVQAVGLAIGLWLVWRVERLARERAAAGPGARAGTDAGPHATT